MVAVASHRELPARGETDFQERYLWHSRNEMHDASPGKRSSHHRIEHWGRIVNWLSMRLHSWCCAIARIREAKSSRTRGKEKQQVSAAFRYISKIIFENHFRKRRFHAAAWVRGCERGLLLPRFATNNINSPCTKGDILHSILISSRWISII